MNHEDDTPPPVLFKPKRTSKRANAQIKKVTIDDLRREISRLNDQVAQLKAQLKKRGV